MVMSDFTCVPLPHFIDLNSTASYRWGDEEIILATMTPLKPAPTALEVSTLDTFN